MTRKEYERDMRDYWERTRGSGIKGTKAPLLPDDMSQRFIEYHKGIVKDALASGKPVPPEVLRDYPILNPTCKIIKTHSDGDLTLKCKDGKYVVTTEGETFKEVKK